MTYYFETQHNKSSEYGHCGRISINNALQKCAIAANCISIREVLEKSGKEHGSIKWGRWTKNTLVAVCQKEGIHIRNLKKTFIKLRCHTYHEITKISSPLILYGQTKSDGEWNHFIATRDGWIYDPDNTERIKLTVDNLHKILCEIVDVYLIWDRYMDKPMIPMIKTIKNKKNKK
jgi:hypothetical protein